MKKELDSSLFHKTKFLRLTICAGASQIALMADEKSHSQTVFTVFSPSPRRVERSGMEDKMLMNGKVMMNRLVSLFAIGILVVAVLCACTRQDLEDMASGEGDGYAVIVWGDKTYVPYGALAAYGERGKQIGIVDGDKDNRVYELKGYSVDEWIVNALPYDAAMLFREIDVTDIPDGWQSEYEWNQ